MSGRVAARLLAVLAAAAPAAARDAASVPPRVLVVTAHPDDETTFAATLFAISRDLGGSVDLAVVTNGEGGFRYATLAEPIYGLRLGEETVGRANLPRIRQRELLAAGAILGIRSYFFLGERDRAYTEDAVAVLDREWDSAAVGRSLREILRRGRYDYVLLLLPTATTHGAHQASALLALEAAASLPEDERPVVLGGTDYRRADPPPPFAGRGEYPLTRVRPELLEFDRTRRRGPTGRLDYQIVVNWVIAEHKSQGLTQTLMNAADTEGFRVFALCGDRGAAAARELFTRLNGARPHPQAREPLPHDRIYGFGACLPPR